MRVLSLRSVAALPRFCAAGFLAGLVVASLGGFAAAVFRLGPAAPDFAADVRSTARPAFSAAARSMIVASISPAAPPSAGRFETQTSGLSAARMSSNSPSLFTLRGANSVMSTSPAQSSRCLIRSQLRESPLLLRPP